MENILVRSVKSTFIYWLLFAIVSVYFSMTFDFNKFKNAEGNFAVKVVQSTSFKNLRLGIDLQGGTRLVLRLNTNKVIQGRLSDVGRSTEKLLKAEGVNISSKTLNNEKLLFGFSSREDLEKAGDFIKKNYPDLDRKTIEIENKLELSVSNLNRDKLVELTTEKSIDILRKRLDSFDVRGLTVSRQGADKIVVGLPGVDDLTGIKEVISKAAKLEFKVVRDSAPSKEILLDNYDGILPPGTMIIDSEDKDRVYLVSVFPDVSGNRITGARASNDNFGETVIIFYLDAEGAKDFRTVTKENIGKELGIILDDKLVNNPRIKEEVGKERSGSINGFKRKEAIKLAQLLRSGSLDSSLIIEQENRVGASLGSDSIAQGLWACLLALLVLFFGSIFYYKLAGLLAAIALFYNILVLLLLLAMFKATLTLAGIAGIVLTVGMAIDASILIFERIREELKTGIVGFSRAVEIGFEGATAVILDSNITTFLAGVVLFWYGGVAVKGFAVTLMVGIISTVITGVFFLRSAFYFCTNVLRMEKISL